MSAHHITRALQGRWYGYYGKVRCPGHDDRDPSLSVRDAEDGKLLVRCYAGCSQEGVIAALRDLGLWPRRDMGLAPRPNSEEQARWRAERETEERQRIEKAQSWWLASRQAACIASTYLQFRGISIAIPQSIREHPALIHYETGDRLPSVVCRVQGPDQKLQAIQRIYLTKDYRRKANVRHPKMALGPISGGAVRLGPAETRLGISEGIENGLAGMEIYPGLPVWAVLSVSNMAAVVLPETVRDVVLLLDGDAPGSPADMAAGRAALALMRRGFKVETIRPPEGKDFNDLLREKAPAPMLAKEARDVVA